MTKAMRSEMVLAGAGFDEGAGSSAAGALGEAERRRISEPVSGPRLICPTPAAAQIDNVRVAEMLRVHFRDVWRIVRRFGVPENSADDAAQEVFIIAARRLSDIAPGSERPFLFASAVRVAANARRALGARRECAEDDSLPEGVDPRPSAEALLDQKRLRQMLDRVLDELPHDLRVCFVLYELEGMSSPEIAELLSIPIGTVASRLRRAREAFEHAAAKLKSRLQPGGGAR
ncbi:MAG TPA: RNA polymerase sigma factor [Polyangiaceae bacterium]|nr:RNA polymerase sigma factor [Polyangiaceae bacterium]